MIITRFLLLLAFTCFHKNMKAVLKLAWGRVVQVSLTFYLAMYLEDQNIVTWKEFPVLAAPIEGTPWFVHKHVYLLDIRLFLMWDRYQ